MEILEIIIDKELFSSKDVEKLGIVENQYLKLVNFKNSTDLTLDDEVLENYDCVVTASELGSAIKKISDGKIVEHLNRENYKKLTYPLFLKSETFLQFLKENNSLSIIISNISINTKIQSLTTKKYCNIKIFH